MENQVTEPDRRTKPQEESVWAASFREIFKISLYLKAAANPSDQSPDPDYRKSGYGRTLWNTVHVKILKGYLKCYPSLSNSHLISYLKGIDISYEVPGWGYFHSLFTPLFLVFCCVIIAILTACSITLCIPTPLQFLGLWQMVLLLSAGFPQSRTPFQVSRTGPVTFTNTLFRFVWWREWHTDIYLAHFLFLPFC